MVHLQQNGICLPGEDAHAVTVDITVNGKNEDYANKVLIHAKDEVVRAMQALDEGEHPDGCEGSLMSINWERVLEDDESEASA